MQGILGAEDGSFSPDIPGTPFTVTFGPDGGVIELTTARLPLRQDTLADMTKKIAEAHNCFPTVSLSVGESVLKATVTGSP